MSVTLENERLSVSFDPAIHAISSLIRKENGENIIKTVLPNSLFHLIGVKNDSVEKVELFPGSLKTERVEREGSTQAICLCYDSVLHEGNEIPVKVEIRVELEDDETETSWTIQVENNSSDYQIIETLFPILRGVYLGDSWEDDILIYPHHAGEKTKAPIRTYTSERFAHFNRSFVLHQENRWIREINYCGLASMMWMYYYDQENGLYFGSHDAGFLVTGLRVETGGPDDPWMGFAFRKHWRVETGMKWTSNPMIIALTGQDWHWGARRYRTWFLSQMEVEKQPEFLQDEITLNQCYNLKRQGEVIHRFSDIPAIYEKGQKLFKARHLFLASWNRGGFDRDYPEFQPDMELGTPLSLAHACQKVKDEKGLVTFYINCRIFHLQSDFFKTLGREWSIKKIDGEMYIEQYGPEAFAVNCPSNNAWVDYIADTAEWMVRSYGADGIYLDQLGSAEPFACYDRSHSHTQNGLFNQGYLQLLRDIHKRLSVIERPTFLMIENCGDLYSAMVWGSLTWNGEAYDEFYTLFKYTFPEFMQVHMVNPLSTLDGEKRWEKYYADLERALRLGAVFWLGVDKIEDNANDPYLQYARKAIALREKLNPYFCKGRFVDDEGVAAATEGLHVAHWLLHSGDHLLVIGNPEQIKNGVVELDFEADDLHIVGEENIEDTAAGSSSTVQRNGHWRVRVSSSRVSFVVLSGK